MFRICYADLSKAFKNNEFKRRPVVVIEDLGNNVKVLKITSRNRNDKYHVRMNNFLIYGFCDISHCYIIPKRYLISNVRDCTISEMESITSKVDKYFSKKY